MLPCPVRAHVGMEPHAKTPPPPVSSLKVIATQAFELLASVLVRTHVTGTEFVVEPVSTPQTPFFLFVCYRLCIFGE